MCEGEGPNGEKYWYLNMWGTCGLRMYEEIIVNTPPER